MQKAKVQAAAVLAFVFGGICQSVGQHSSALSDVPGRAGTQGNLTVTLTVVSSVGLVTGPDGRQRVVVANAAAASDNVSSLQYARLTDVSSSGNSTSQPSAGPSAKTGKK